MTASTPSSSEESLKWSCDYCTYLNWPLATKCTLCRARKPLLIGDSSQPYPDIYSLAKNQPTTASTDAVDIHQLIVSGEVKWSCQVCTYFNWPRSAKCVQCSNLRNKRLAEDSDTITDENTVALGAKSPRQSSQTSEDLSTAATEPLIKPNESQQGSPEAKGSDVYASNWVNRSVSASPTANEHDGQQPSSSASTLIDSRILAKKLQKWTCFACTYENWPKGNRCVMCYTPRPTTSLSSRDSPTLNNSCSPGGSPVYGSDNEGSNSAVVNDKKRNYNSVTGAMGCHSYKSPRSASSSTENVNTEVGATAASSTVTEVFHLHI